MRQRSAFRWQGSRTGVGAEYVLCRLCCRSYRIITNTHLRHVHQLSVSAYERRFPKSPMTCLEVREKESESQGRRQEAIGGRWTEGRIVRELRRRAATRRPLNLGAVQSQDPALSEAIRRYFPSWDEALHAAGLDPAQIRKWERWTAELFRSRIQALKRKGVPLSWSAAGRHDPRLLKATYVVYGNWSKALRALGEKPVYDHGRWSKAEVVRTLRKKRHTGKPLYAQHIIRTGGSRLYHAALSRFGSWASALRAAGIDPAKVERRRVWTKKSVLLAIRKVCRKRSPLGMEDEDPGLVRVARKFYGGWPHAVAAAGVRRPALRAGISRKAGKSRATGSTS